jgi:hypothetical protein
VFKLWHVDPLLGNDHEINSYTTAVTNSFAKKNVCMATIGNSNSEMVFSVQSLLRCYKQNNWSNELIVRQSPAGKNVSMEAEDIVGICNQARTGEDIAVCALVTVICEVCRTVIA